MENVNVYSVSEKNGTLWITGSRSCRFSALFYLHLLKTFYFYSIHTVVIAMLTESSLSWGRGCCRGGRRKNKYISWCDVWSDLFACYRTRKNSLWCFLLELSQRFWVFHVVDDFAGADNVYVITGWKLI